MKTTKRIFAILLTLCMLASTLCLPAFATESAPTMTTVTKTSVLNNVGDGKTYNLETVLGDGVSDVKIIDSGDDCIVMRGTVTGGGQVNAYCNKLLTDGFTPYCATNGSDVIGYVLGLTGSAARHQTYTNSIFLVNIFWSSKLAANTLTVTWEPLPFAKAETEANADYLSVFTAPTSVNKVCEPVAIQMGLDVDDAYDTVETTKVDIRAGMSYVFRLSDGSFVIYDGGADNADAYSNAKYGKGGTALRKNMYRLLDILNTYAVDKNDIRIAAWLITHPHSDHYKLFEQVVKEMYTPTNSHYDEYSNITIERVITNYPSLEQLDNCTNAANSDGSCNVLTEAGLTNRRSALATCETNGVYLYKAHVGQTYYLADAKIDILYTEDIALTASGNASCSHESGDQSQTNRLSIISQLTLPVDGYDVKFMITGDAEGDAIKTVNNIYGTALKSDFVQAPHHGNIDTQTSALQTFYETNVKSGYLLVPTSDDWWNGEVINEGDVGRITYAPLYTKYKDGTATNYTCKYADVIGLENTFIAGSVSHEFEMTVTDGVLSVTPAVLAHGGNDIEKYMTLDGHTKLISDITLDSALHLGTFKGVLDGMGHTLTILGEYTATASYGMLFNGLSYATVKNIQIGTEEDPVKFVASAATAGSNIGVLGSNGATGNTLENVDVYVDANLNGFGAKNLNFGAFFGKNSTGDGSITMTNCTANGKIYGSLSGTKYMGGFIGSWTAGALTLTNCTNNVDIEVNGIKANGGFVGIFNKDVGSLNVTNCVNNGNISGTTVSGGIVGLLSAGSVTLTNAVNNGSITGAEGTVGSMVASNSGTLAMTGCVNLGTLNGGTVSETGIAGIVAQANKGAGVRIHNTAEESGLRFRFEMDAASIAALNKLVEDYGADNVEIGAVILPTALLRAEVALTAENYTNALVMADSASELEGNSYYASLVKLYENHYNTAYSCQSFYRFRASADSEWITVYANNTLSRTIAEVAAEALNDPNKPNYSQEQLDILTAYANAQNG